ncbi:MAG: hypothetical protein ACLP52_20460 [Streptosporangiaceae bacterium]
MAADCGYRIVDGAALGACQAVQAAFDLADEPADAGDLLLR